MGTQEHGKVLKRIQVLEDGRVPAKEAKRRIEGQKKIIMRREYQRLLNKKERNGRFYGAKRIVESRWRKDLEGKRRVAQGRR